MNLVEPIVEPVFALELGLNGLAQGRSAVDRGVAGLAGVNGADGGFTDVLRRVEIGLAGAKSDDIAALGLELCGFGRDRNRWRRFYPVEASSKHGHVDYPAEAY